MNKNELSKILAKELGTNAQDANKIIDAFCDAIKKSVTANNPVAIRGFGTFSLLERQPKVVRRFNRGTTYVANLAPRPKFSASNEWQQSINKKFNSTK